MDGLVVSVCIDVVLVGVVLFLIVWCVVWWCCGCVLCCVVRFWYCGWVVGLGVGCCWVVRMRRFVGLLGC